MARAEVEYIENWTSHDLQTWLLNSDVLVQRWKTLVKAKNALVNVSHNTDSIFIL
jgi:hypothetical protein